MGLVVFRYFDRTYDYETSDLLVVRRPERLHQRHESGIQWHPHVLGTGDLIALRVINRESVPLRKIINPLQYGPLRRP
jgi:hypothetical protein